MPIFTSLLFLFFVAAMLPLVFRGGRNRQARREQSALAERMFLGASICIASAREAFGVELDRSIESIAMLDQLMTNGWRGTLSPEAPPLLTPAPEQNDVIFVLGAYIGTAFALHREAEWQIKNGKPALLFRSTMQSEYPLELAELKRREPDLVNLSLESAQWGLPPELSPAVETNSAVETDPVDEVDSIDGEGRLHG